MEHIGGMVPVRYQSAGLLESSVRYSSYAKYRPNEEPVPLEDFNFNIKHENVYIGTKTLSREY